MRNWLAAMLVAAVALLTIVSGIGNGFAYDDIPVIVEDSALHAAGTAVPRAFAPYFDGQMVRPIPLIGFALQWVIGEGAPIAFRIGSMGLYALACVLVLMLCQRAGASLGAALLGGLAFAVHPVHNEVTANGVGQGELWAATVVVGTVLWYLRAREAPLWRTRDTACLAMLCLLATHTKEVGYVLPGLLVAVEFLVVRDPRRWRARAAMLREPALGLAGAMLASLAIRNFILGELGGGQAHGSLVGLGIADRTVAALGLVPQWFRLLLWPAHLQADYGPPALAVATTFGPPEALGLALLAAAGIVVAATWRRVPLVAMGLLWIGLALMPVANVIVPTGILLAERTLFLPSVGLALAMAGTADAVHPYLERHRWSRGLAYLGAGVLLLLAGWRSAVRQPAWRDTRTLLEVTVRDAPTTYRTHLLLGRELRRDGDLAGAEAAFRQATLLWQEDSRPFEELGQLLRAQGRCAEAIPVLQRGVVADSTSDTARSRLVECLIVEQRWDEAEREIERGLAQGVGAYRSAARRAAEGQRAGKAP